MAGRTLTLEQGLFFRSIEALNMRKPDTTAVLPTLVSIGQIKCSNWLDYPEEGANMCSSANA